MATAESHTTRRTRVLLAGEDVAEVFGVTSRTVRRWARAGHLRPVLIGGIVRYRAEDVDRLIHPNHDAPAGQDERVGTASAVDGGRYGSAG